jgi:transcription-repair coupling factor (superfamily II helicase)
LHNKIQSIDYYTDRLRGFFPKETVENIHGQQNSRVLEKNLLGFFSGKISVLVCSTIIESGLDVSNANCIIINNPQNRDQHDPVFDIAVKAQGFEGC